jgi:predicted HTH transcriptional regulator
MPHKLLTNQQEEILSLLARNPGLTSKGIRNGLKNSPTMRTVQRRLVELLLRDT